MSKLLIPSNFSTSNVTLVNVELEAVENLDDSAKADFGVEEPEVESPA